jgi:hypothetical protein
MSRPLRPVRIESFGNFNAPDYNDHNYRDPWPADKIIAQFVTTTIARQLGSRFGSFSSLYEIGNGGTMRTAPFGEPLLRPGACVTLTDVEEGESQLAAIRSTVARAREGDLGYWARHQEIMGPASSRWSGAITRLLCNYPIEIKPHDISRQPVPPVSLRVEGHVLCSRTSVEEEYWQGVKNFYSSMRPGDVAIRVYDVESDSYMVDGYEFSGYPINQENIHSEARALGLVTLGVYETPVDTSITNAATASTLSGIGGAVLLRP